MNKLRLSDKWMTLVLMILFAFVVVLLSFSMIAPVYLFIRYIAPIALGICLIAILLILIFGDKDKKEYIG
jgi:polyferredoxin